MKKIALLLLGAAFTLHASASLLNSVQPPIPEQTEEAAPSELFGWENADSLDEKPSFQDGGFEVFQSWVSRQMRYPQELMENGIMGNVVVSFVVEKDGSISTIKIEKSAHKLMEQEVLRIFALVPNWKPGMLNGEPVRMKFVLPVMFRYQ